jgi:hypothetical protein
LAPGGDEGDSKKQYVSWEIRGFIFHILRTWEASHNCLLQRNC